jgi:hypothetical protein
MNDRDKMKHLLAGDWLYHKEVPKGGDKIELRTVDSKTGKVCFYTRLCGANMLVQRNTNRRSWHECGKPPDDCQLVTWAVAID